jgi:hypothetical protein
VIEILPKTQLEIQEGLHEVANKHASRSNGFLHLLPIDAETYPGQALTQRVIKSDGVLNPAEADGTAAKIDTRYLDLIRAYDEYTHDDAPTYSRFHNIQNAVNAGENIINGTDHAELVDILFSHLHFANRLKRGQELKGSELGESPEKTAKTILRSGLIISKMVDFLAVEYDGIIVPIRDLLPLGIDKTYLTIPNNPQSDSVFERSVIKRYNKNVRGEIHSDLRKKAFSNRRPMVLGVALPGTVNKKSLDDPNTLIVGRANDAIVGFSADALTVTSAVRMREKGSQVFIDDRMTNMYKPEQLHGELGRLAQSLSELDNRPYIYDLDGTMPTEEPDSFRVS